MKAISDFRTLLRRVHNDEKGAVSIETILIIAAISLPILFFVLKFGWPRVQQFFNDGMANLEEGAADTRDGGGAYSP